MKRSSFNLDIQNQNTDSKIVVALERISEAFRVLLWDEGKKHALSPIQIQILIFVKHHQEIFCKVGYIAKEFNMTKATVSDSIRVLLNKQLVTKFQDERDSRSFTIHLTSEGSKFVQNLETFAAPVRNSLKGIETEKRETLLSALISVISDLNKSGVISVQRMCTTCSNYSKSNGIHYCSLLKAQLADSDLRLDCPEHDSL